MRYKITIQYDGSYFSGWQLQKKQNTVQGLLEKIFGGVGTQQELPTSP